MNPYLIEPPFVVSFSGGRTSAFMLWNILQAHGGVLPDGGHVCFANTGKEREETLTFVNACATGWGVKVHWLEFDAAESTAERFKEVDYVTAARNGEPFEALIRMRQFLPNPVARFCTQELKIRVIEKFLIHDLGLEDWTCAIGIRADEPKRWKIENRGSRWQTNVLPLRRAGVTREHVDEFWSQQPFTLNLRQWEGNCDLCFLKGRAKKVRIMRDRPDLAAWWVERERERESKTSAPAGARFRADSASYATMLKNSRLPMLFDPDDESEMIDCLCGDAS